MQVSLETTRGLERRMKVQVPAERVEREVEEQLKSLTKKARVDGFRPGKVPLKVLRERFGDQVRSDVVRDLLQSTFSEALALLSSDTAPTAFLCLGTRILSGVLQAIRHSGRTVPDDVSVISIGDTDLSQLFTPAITSLTWDLAALGTACAEVLLRNLSAREARESERILITTQMILRESCVPPPVAAPARMDARV